MKHILNIREFIRRWKAPSPLFWKKIQSIALSVGVSCGILILAYQATPIIYPDWFFFLLQYGAVAGAIGFILSRLTEDTKGASEAEINEIIKKQMEAIQKMKEVKEIIQNNEAS